MRIKIFYSFHSRRKLNIDAVSLANSERFFKKIYFFLNEIKNSFVLPCNFQSLFQFSLFFLQKCRPQSGVFVFMSSFPD